MTSKYEINVRAFPVTIRDERTGEISEDTITLEKGRLRAVGEIGMDAEALIFRVYNLQGYRVLKIGAPVKRTIGVDLNELFKLHSVHQAGKRVG